MRFGILASVLATALVAGGEAAKAEWHAYFVKQGGGFSFTAPGEMTAGKITYTSATAGQRKGIVFASSEDNVEYTITVVDFTGRAHDEAALLKEAAAASRDRTKILMDEEARVDSSEGLKLTVDLPDNAGRAMHAIYFKDERLIQLQAIVRPGGNYLSADMGRFVDSLAFYDTRSDQGATELKLPD